MIHVAAPPGDLRSSQPPKQRRENDSCLLSPFRHLHYIYLLIYLPSHLSALLLLSLILFPSLSRAFRLLPTYLLPQHSTLSCARQLHRHPLVRGKPDRQFSLEQVVHRYYKAGMVLVRNTLVERQLRNENGIIGTLAFLR